MITRIPLRCMACQQPLTFRIQVGHEREQPVASVCIECFTPIRLRLYLDDAPAVHVEFVENCEATDAEGTIINVGAGFVIPRARRHEEGYFPVFDLPEPDDALQRIQAEGPADAEGPIAIDLMVLLGGLPQARDRWRQLRNAYRFARTGQLERMQALLLALFEDACLPEEITIEDALVSFFVRFLCPHRELTLAPHSYLRWASSSRISA
ncbi:hypothetical protein [Dokdonella soli]|uniref:Uncharacterized protein n=1 Tax=Dokdonella soli TaxID=529810 RepID=A0ABN1ICU8_9GAMM